MGGRTLHQWRQAIRWLLLLLLLAGCASSPPARFYALSAVPGTPSDVMPTTLAPSVRPLAVALGPVSLPAFLDRQQIVMRTSANRLAIDDFARWGGNPRDEITRVWGENLAAQACAGRWRILAADSREPPDVQVSAEILAFEGQPDGTALLAARWLLFDPRTERPLHERQSRHARALASGRAGADTTDALVGALSAALGDFSREVGAALCALPAPASK